ncbi:ATP-binding protein, partial [Micromonospora sp. URMC 107]
MNRSSTPGSPAGRPAVPHGNRARSFDYPDNPEADEVALDPALVTSPGHGGVGVFQAPRPAPRRTPPAEQQPAGTGDSADIDSPFLDLFGGTRPRPAAPSQRASGREHPAIGQQPAAAPAALPPAPAPLP